MQTIKEGSEGNHWFPPMDKRLDYHTSLTSHDSGFVGSGSTPYIKTLQYYTSLQSSDIAFDNLKKINNKLDDKNVIALAYLANNPYLTADERDKYSNKLKEMAMKEYQIFSTYINDIIHRNENSSADITERND
jgi:hypothetical protein